MECFVDTYPYMPKSGSNIEFLHVTLLKYASTSWHGTNTKQVTMVPVQIANTGSGATIKCKWL